MKPADRRRFLQLAGGALTLPLAAPLVCAAELLPRESKRVVIVGGGFAGAIAAKTLRLANRAVEVVLVERNRSYAALPGSNWVIGGSRRSDEGRIAYAGLESAYGVRMVYGEALQLDIDARKVVLAEGTLSYDAVIVAPGIGLRTGEIEGYNAEAQAACPHAWTSGDEVAALTRQLEAMKDGGVVLVSLPLPPFRCPQAAYERVSQMAFHLKQAKPRAKIIVLDASPAPTQLAELFRSGWARDYGGLIDYRGGQPVIRVDAQRRLWTASETLRGDVVNLIPPQAAGALAHQSGLVGAGGRWCPVDHSTYESTLAAGVYVIGDACLGDDLQKTATAANAQGKACALNLAAAMGGRKPQAHTFANVCYSLLNDRDGASSLVFHRGDGRQSVRLDKGGGMSTAWSPLEGTYARAWLGSILTEMSS